ncbi:hypothetical protein [Aquimarina celericrescens]|uniref:Acyltransferase n=1 Tax=Aquimarina celericrescens TaxID=1964542 RepID=A0ABW5AVS3_9FLAO|nr:acyltransferase [Aquimarina celericrescens]
MLFFLLRYYYRIKPQISGFIFKLLFSHKKLKIGKNFQCDTFPKVLLDKTASIEIGNNVIFRRNVELRAHGTSKVNIGDNCRIDRGVRILGANKAQIVFEEGVRMGLYTVLNGGDSIRIGKKSLVSGYVYLQTSMHNYEGNSSIQKQGYTHAPIDLGNDIWLGTHVVIFPGTTLGDKSIVGSSSVVNQSFDQNSIVAGIPAKLIKKRS